MPYGTWLDQAEVSPDSKPQVKTKDGGHGSAAERSTSTAWYSPGDRSDVSAIFTDLGIDQSFVQNTHHAIQSTTAWSKTEANDPQRLGGGPLLKLLRGAIGQN